MTLLACKLTNLQICKYDNLPVKQVCYYTSRQSTNNQILATLRPYIESRNFSMEDCSWVIFTIYGVPFWEASMPLMSNLYVALFPSL